MTTQEIKKARPVVSIVNNQATTTSLNVADVFGKQHKDVLRAISGLEIPNDFKERNFAPVNIIEKNAIGGNVDKSYVAIAFDGFVLLVMGFTGAKAMKFKLAYIEAFNKMEAALRGKALPPPSEPAFALADDPAGKKRCCRCRVTKDRSEFERYATAPDGLNYMCKACRSVQRRTYAMANRKRNLALEGRKRPIGLPDPSLTPEQQRAVQVLITERVYATKNKPMYPSMFRIAYRSIKDRFKVAKYNQVPAAKFAELVEFLHTVPIAAHEPEGVAAKDALRLLCSICRLAVDLSDEMAAILLHCRRIGAGDSTIEITKKAGDNSNALKGKVIDLMEMALAGGRAPDELPPLLAGR